MPIHIPVQCSDTPQVVNVRYAVERQKKYQIKIHSCRKDTLVTFYLDREQLKLVQAIATATQLASQSECEPTLFVNEVRRIKPNN